MALGLEGRGIPVACASRGLGAAIAEAAAAEGAKVAAVARPSDELTATAERIGGIAIPRALSALDAPAEVAHRAIEALGGLDGLVVNSGGPPAGTFTQLDDAAGAKANGRRLLPAVPPV